MLLVFILKRPMFRKQIPEHHKKRLDAISLYLKELRFSNGMTQKELSQELNLNRNTIINAENSKNITIINIMQLADALNISLKDLFAEID